MKPTLGRIVMFVCDSVTATDIARLGGNRYAEGDNIPAVIVRVWNDTGVNLKLLLDGPSDLWVTSVGLSSDNLPRSWNWPQRVEEAKDAAA